jgi:DNA adenine methylase
MTVQGEASTLRARGGARSNPLSAARASSGPTTLLPQAHHEPKPFVKWVGGKRQLLPHLIQNVPRRFHTYHEPFVGGGALFFRLKPERAILSDNNERLVRTYLGVRNAVGRVVKLLKSFRHDREFYLEFRSADIDQATDAEVAAWFIYLNKTGYNGLYRVNQSDRFNVPFGDHKNPTICDEANLRACSRILQRAEIRHESFESIAEEGMNRAVLTAVRLQMKAARWPCPHAHGVPDV